MSDKVELKELPHQFLMRKYKLTKQHLNADGKQMLTDLEKTLRLVSANAVKKGGNISLTPATQQKITTYDKMICMSIYDYLEDKEIASESQIEKVEEQLDDKREDVEEKMDDLYNEAKEELEEIKQEQAQQVEANEIQAETDAETESENEQTKENTDDKKDESVRIGFWDWE